jgi:UDP-glucose 4-epimerase
MAKKLILGGAGFIGSNLARQLVSNGEEVKILSRSSASIANIEDILDDVDFVFGDFLDDVTLRSMTKGVDVVFHLISTTFPGMAIQSSVYDVLSNLLPTIRLVEACLENGVKKIVYASSGGTVYGEPLEIPVTEKHPLLPKSPYGQSKLTIENYLNFYARLMPLDINVLRISNPYGAGQKLLGVQGIIAVAMGCVYYNREINIYGKGDIVRDFIYIQDVVNALTIAAQVPGSSIVNISSGKGHSIIEIVEAVEKVCGREIRKKYLPEREGDVKVNILSNEKAFDLYHWLPAVELQEGLELTWKKISQI